MSEQKPNESEVDIEPEVIKIESANSDSHCFSAAHAADTVSDALRDKTNPEELLDALLNLPEDSLIPWEEVPLPSRGLYYSGAIPGGVVKVRAMGTFADRILATARLAQSGQSIDYLLEHCVQLPNKFPPLELLAGDRVFLLYALRGITHDNIYEFMIECPNCEAMQNCTYDLNDLQRTLTVGNPSIPEPAKVILPYLSATTKRETWVEVRFLRGKDVSALAQKQRFNKKLKGTSIRSAGQRNVGKMTQKPVVIDDTLTENLNMIVVSFMGVQDPFKIKSLMTKLHGSDTAAIREFLRQHSPGIDTTIEVPCNDCGTNFRTELPITESFFRPAVSGGVRA